MKKIILWLESRKKKREDAICKKIAYKAQEMAQFHPEGNYEDFCMMLEYEREQKNIFHKIKMNMEKRKRSEKINDNSDNF